MVKNIHEPKKPVYFQLVKISKEMFSKYSGTWMQVNKISE